MEIDERILDAVQQTEILRPPKQSLSTFGTTNIYYYLLTEPSYSEIENAATETVIQGRRVIAERPRVVTPLLFNEARWFRGRRAALLRIAVEYTRS